VVPLVYVAVTAWLLARIVWDARPAMSSTIGLLFTGHPVSALAESLKAPPLASLVFIIIGLPVYFFLARQARSANEE
jgi:hypothetical protein